VSDVIAPAAADPMVIARLVRSADFERVLRTRTRAHSVHFAVHHIAGRPSAPARPAAGELSTADGRAVNAPVDDSSIATPHAVWLGAVVPKRHARRAVTRTLLKRQIRVVVTGHASSMAGGLWVVRLRAPFDRNTFLSAASSELKRAARAELELLLCTAAPHVVAG
jgi:ribonuclease P protein component